MVGPFALAVKTVQTLKVLLPCTEVFRTLSCQSVLFMTCYRGSHPSSNRFGNLVLNIENIFQGTVPLFRPEVVVFFGIIDRDNVGMVQAESGFSFPEESLFNILQFILTKSLDNPTVLIATALLIFVSLPC